MRCKCRTKPKSREYKHKQECFMYEQSRLVEGGARSEYLMDMMIIYQYTVEIGTEYVTSSIYFNFNFN